MSHREQVLSSVRNAIKGAPAPAIPRDYVRQLDHDQEGLIALFAERVDDYRAEVRQLTRANLASTIGDVLAAHSATSVVVPDDLDPHWLTTVTCEVVRDNTALTARELDRVGAVITGSAVGVALTGTIVLDAGPLQGRRVISLIPDLHICVVDADAIVGTVSEAVARLDGTRPLTWISGPSATSDIELDRVEGVHGPRTLVVLIIRD